MLVSYTQSLQCKSSEIKINISDFFSALQTLYYILSRTEQNSALLAECVSQPSSTQNHLCKTRASTLNNLLVLYCLWKLKVNSSTVHHFCPLFIYLIHPQNKLLDIFLGLCIFLVYLLTFFYWMRLYLFYLVYLYFYMKVRL